MTLETWQQLSRDSLRAAEVLLREGHYRSSVSRAYYAAYCAATHEIVQRVTTFSYGRNNPSHGSVPSYIQNNLTLPQAKKDTVSSLVSILRLFREDADYRPHMTVGELIARDCIRTASEIQQELWGTSP